MKTHFKPFAALLFLLPLASSPIHGADATS